MGERTIKRLESVIRKAHEIYNANFGGCMFIAACILSECEKRHIKCYVQQFADEDDHLHYCAIIDDDIIVNYIDGYDNPKLKFRTSEDAFEFYNMTAWSQKYDKSNNYIIHKMIENVFEEDGRR